MSKRIILGVLAGTAVFGAIFGLAAALDVNSEDLSAGHVAVSSCDGDGVHTAYTHVPATGLVTTVTVSDIADACVGDQVTVRIHQSDGGGGFTYITSGTATVSAGTANDNSTAVTLDDETDPEIIDEVEVILNGNGDGVVG